MQLRRSMYCMVEGRDTSQPYVCLVQLAKWLTLSYNHHNLGDKSPRTAQHLRTDQNFFLFFLKFFGNSFKISRKFFVLEISSNSLPFLQENLLKFAQNFFTICDNFFTIPLKSAVFKSLRKFGQFFSPHSPRIFPQNFPWNNIFNQPPETKFPDNIHLRSIYAADTKHQNTKNPRPKTPKCQTRKKLPTFSA